MEKAEYAENGGFPQRDSTECEGYAGARSAVCPETGETGSRQPDLLEKILSRDNLNNAYKRVKANKGAPGVDGMTVEAALPWLKEHGAELTESIRQGKYKAERNPETGRGRAEAGDTERQRPNRAASNRPGIDTYL